MKSVLISIRPKWCELITSGRKTVEVRKTRPRLETPFKCYIYETKGKVERTRGEEDGYCYQEGRSAVIGEFVCDTIYEIKNVGNAFKVGKTASEANKVAYASCLDFSDMHDYFGQKGGYGWRISNLKIYKTTKRLSEFMFERHKNGMYIHAPVFRAPQSWMYVEEDD